MSGKQQISPPINLFEMTNDVKGQWHSTTRSPIRSLTILYLQ
jgi:hypothetical protein